MATYPTLATLTESEVLEVDGQQVDYMENNQPRIRNYADASRYRARIAHILSPTDMATLHTFYDANRSVSFSYVFPGEGSGSPWVTTYTMYFTRALQVQRIRPAGSPANAMYRVEVYMEGTG